MRWSGRTIAVVGLPGLVACGAPATSDPRLTSCPNDLPASCAPAAPSYQQEVAGILSQRCVSCHRPAGTVPTPSLDTYAAVFQRRRDVLNQVFHCEMPPAGATPLTAQERAVLQLWLICGAPQN